MAWSEQCKIAFHVDAKGRYLTQKGRKNLTRVLKELSADSGIPHKTLERWWYELESLKNEVVKGRPTKLQQKREKKKAEQKKEPESVKEFKEAWRVLRKIIYRLRREEWQGVERHEILQDLSALLNLAAKE